MQQIKKELRQLLDKTYKTDADKNWFNQYAIGNNLTDEQKIEFLKLPVNERNQRLQDYEFQKGGDHIGSHTRRQQQQQESSEESEYVDNKSSEKSDASQNERTDSFQFRDEEDDQYTYEQLQSLILSKQQFNTMLTCPFFNDLVPYIFLFVTIEEKDSVLLSVNHKGKESNFKHKQGEKHHEKNSHNGSKYYSLVQLEPHIYYEKQEIITEFNPANHNIDNVYFKVQAPREHAGAIIHINNIGEELTLIYKPQLYEKQYKSRYEEFLSPLQEIKQFIYQQRYVPGQTLKRQQKLLTQDQLMNVMDYAIYGMNESSALYCLNSFFNYPGNLKSTHITECMDQCILRIKGLGYIVQDINDLTDEQKNIITTVQQTEVALSDQFLMEAKDIYEDDVFQLITKFNSRLIEEDKRYNDFLNQNKVITIDSRFMKANDADRAIDKARQLIRQYLNKNAAESTLKQNTRINDLKEEITKEQQNFLMEADAGNKFIVNLSEKTIQIDYEGENGQKPAIYLTSPVYQCILLEQTNDIKNMIDPIQISQYKNLDTLKVTFTQKRMQKNNRVTFFFDLCQE